MRRTSRAVTAAAVLVASAQGLLGVALVSVGTYLVAGLGVALIVAGGFLLLAAGFQTLNGSR